MLTSDQDTEITLGMGRMLVLFFGLVVVCGFFFAVGFSFGRKTAAAASPGAAAVAGQTPAEVVRPSAAKNTQPVSPSQDLTFYKSVEQKSADASLTPPETQSQPVAAPAAEGQKTDAADAASAPAASPATGAYYVQVAAVSRAEDADALVEALKKKQYPAFTATNASADKFFHVQVGPYAELKDAEAMRTRLIGDGYNPIVKK
jgi:cell division septation protein DedD